MERIVDYKIIDNFLQEILELEVQKEIKNGRWQPLGAPFYATPHFRQAMVKYAPEEPEKEEQDIKIVTADNWDFLEIYIKRALQDGWKRKGLPYILDYHGEGEGVYSKCCQIMVKYKGDCEESSDQRSD